MGRFGAVLALAAGIIVSAFTFASRAEAAIVVRVDKASQTMRVIVDGEHRHTWAVSTGRMGYNTPNGTYSPQRLERNWRSRKYNMAPMPHSIFFRGGFAIHGTNRVGRLGRTDSHGCIRLAPGNARALFEMVARQRGATRIVIEGTASHGAPMVAARRGNSRVAAAPARTTQMRLAQPAERRVHAGSRTAARAAMPATVRAMYPASSQAVAPARPAPRVATTAPRAPLSIQPAAARSPGGNAFFGDWFLRR